MRVALGRHRRGQDAFASRYRLPLEVLVEADAHQRDKDECFPVHPRRITKLVRLHADRSRVNPAALARNALEVPT
jgi:hypothetical protein